MSAVFPPHSPRGHRVHIPITKQAPPSARERLQLSQLNLTQLELMGEDVDLDTFKLEMHKVMPVDIIDRITDASVERTIAGASTFQVNVDDTDRTLLKSGYLTKNTDIQIDGLWWRLVQVKKQSDTLSLIFEEREIAVLRTYLNPIKASAATSRTVITRAEFILRLIREPYEFKNNPIPYVIPDLTKVEPIGLSTDAVAADVTSGVNRSLGFAPGAQLTVKGVAAAPVQVKNGSIVLQVGASMLVPRPVLVAAIMCAIQESGLYNLGQPIPGMYNYLSPNPDWNPVGVFQQIKHWGWPASRDVAQDAKAFFDKAAPLYNSEPTQKLQDLIVRVQNSGDPAPYARWRQEAEDWVTAYGVPPGSQAASNRQWQQYSGNQMSGNYEFYRGIPPTRGSNIWLPETSWDCITRLAQEVNWRAFFVSGTFYYLDDDALFLSKPRARVTEGQGGVDYIDFDYDEFKKIATVTVYCRIGRWNVPPGCVVELYNMGILDGRWLVTDVTRSIFSSSGVITLQKPQPQLPEPLSDSGSAALSGVYKSGYQTTAGGTYVNPFPGGWIPNRLDMGWDGTFTGSIAAPFDGTITYADFIGGSHPWGGYLVLKAKGNVLGLPTRSLYFAEGVSALLPAGSEVKAGDIIAKAGPSPYGDPYGTHQDGQIEWGVAEDQPVGVYSKPYAQKLGLGTKAAADMVKNFVGWAHMSLGVVGNPTDNSTAGNT